MGRAGKAIGWRCRRDGVHIRVRVRVSAKGRSELPRGARYAIQPRLVVGAIALLPLVVVVGCDLSNLDIGDGVQAPASAIVARVGTVEIAAANLHLLAAGLPERERRALDGQRDAKRRLLEPLIREAALFEAAVRNGTDRQPDVARRIRQVVVEAWMAEQRALLRAEGDVPEAELRVAFEHEQNDPRRRPLVQVRVIWLATRERAEAVRAALLSQPGDLARVGELARTESLDESTRDRGGDLGYIGPSSVGVPRAVVRAALGIQHDWGVADPVADGQRWAVVLRTAAVPRIQRSFEQVRAALQAELGQQRREQALTERVDQIRAAAQIVWDDQILARLRVSAPTRTSVPGVR